MPNIFWPPPLVIDMLRFVGSLSHRKVRLLKSGLPGKRELQAINQLLLKPLDISEVKHFEESGYILFLYEISYQLDLFIEREGQLYPQRSKLNEFIDKNPFDQQKELLKAFCQMVLWNESNHLVDVKFHPVDEQSEESPLSLSRILQARKELIKWLPDLLDEASTMPQILQRCEEKNADLLQLAPEEEGPYPGVFLQKEENSQPAKYPKDWELVEGAFLAEILRTGLIWLGCITKQSNQDEEDLYQLAETWITEEQLPAHIQAPSDLIIQANLDLLLFPGHDQVTLLTQLEYFCRPLDGERILRYHIDKDRFFNALQTGKSFAQMRNFLEQHSRTPIPTNVIQLMQNWFHQSNQIIISKNGAVLETSSEAELLELLHDWPEDLPHTLLNKTSLFIPIYAHPALREWLKTRSPVQEIDSQHKPPKSLSIRSSLQIDLDPPCDLLVEPFLLKITKPSQKEQRGQRKSFQMTQETLQNAMNEGLGFDEILEFLEKRAKVFSSTAQLRLDSFAKQLGRVFVGESCILIAENPKTLDRLEHEGGLGNYLQRVGDTVAIIPEGHLKIAKELLASFSLPNTTEPEKVLAKNKEPK